MVKQGTNVEFLDLKFEGYLKVKLKKKPFKMLQFKTEH